jgi:hypothetical protein
MHIILVNPMSRARARVHPNSHFKFRLRLVQDPEHLAQRAADVFFGGVEQAKVFAVASTARAGSPDGAGTPDEAGSPDGRLRRFWRQPDGLAWCG